MVDEVDCIVKIRDDYEVHGDAILENVDEVFSGVVNLEVGYVWNDVKVVGDVRLLVDATCQIAVVDRVMIEVVVDDVLKLNDDDKNHMDDLVDEDTHNVEDEGVLDISVNEVAERGVDENVDVDLDVLVRDDVVVFLYVSVEVIFEDDVAEQ